MDRVGNSSTGRVMLQSAPRSLRVGVLCVELLLVALVAYQLVLLVFDMMKVDAGPRPLTVPGEVSSEKAIDSGRLVSFDPFFRQIAGELAVTPSASVRESSLRIEVFGLRATDGGAGSAIIKTQDGGQKLVMIGDTVVPGVRLSAVYPDRLEVNRAGIREAIYMTPQRARQDTGGENPPAPATVAGQPRATSGFDLANIELSPVRRDRRIIGFRLPDPLPLLLVGSGLEAGDVLTSVNGEPLASFERLQEVGEQIVGSDRLSLEIERRGEQRQLSVNLGGNR